MFLYTNVHSSIFHNSQKVELNVHQLLMGYIKCSISIQWGIIWQYKEMKILQDADRFYKMAEPRKHDAK